MAKIIFTKDAASHTFTVARVAPIHDPLKVNVVMDYSDGGKLYAYDKGITEQFFTLDFTNLSAADNAALLDWFENTSIGPLNTFIFTDEDSTGHTVRWIDLEYPIQKEEETDRYTGTIQLRKEI